MPVFIRHSAKADCEYPLDLIQDPPDIIQAGFVIGKNLYFCKGLQILKECRIGDINTVCI